MEPPEKTGQSRLDSLIGIIKAFLRIDPMMALIALIIIVPLAIPIIQAVLAGDTIVTLTFIVFIAGITIFVYIPLIIVRTWQKNQREISGKQQEAIDTEAEIRLINERNKQKRFNDVTDARLETLTAQTQFILDQSDRHERVLLKQISEDLGEHFKKGMPFVDKDECAVNVSNLLQEFNKVHIDYDEVIASISRIESALKITKEDLPPVKIVEDPDQTNWEKIASVRQNIIEDQLKEIDDLAAKNESQAKTIRDMVHSRPPVLSTSPIPGIPDQPDGTSPPLPKTGFVLEETLFAPEEEIKAAMESIESLKDETVDEPLPETFEQEMDKHLKELEKGDSKRAKAEGLIVLAPQEPPKNWWTCKYCNNDNPLKAPRCKKCGKGKVQPS